MLTFFTLNNTNIMNLLNFDEGHVHVIVDSDVYNAYAADNDNDNDINSYT